MKQKFFSIWSALALLAVMTACSKSSPTTPSSTDASGQPAAVTLGKTGVTLTTPSAVSPSDGQQVKFGEQPLKLVVAAAVTSGTTPPAYTFDVATDGGFANIAFSKAGVASSGGNQQSLTIDKLPGSKTYFWRARATVGDAQGLNSKPRSFTIGPEVALQTPTPAAPSQNGTVNGTGVLVTNNVGRSGPVIQVAYKFDVSDSASFGNIVFTTTVAEQQGSQTATTIDTPLTNNGTYFWRVQALDAANGVTTPFSSVFSFHYVAFDLNQATILNSPGDLANWAQTAKITSVVFTPSAFLVDFDKREGPGRWPDTPFGDGSLEYTLRDVSESQRTLVLLGGRPVLVRPRARSVRRPVEHRGLVVLRSGAVGTDGGLSAVRRRDRGHFRLRGQLPQQHRRRRLVRQGTVERRARAVVERRRRQLLVHGLQTSQALS